MRLVGECHVLGDFNVTACRPVSSVGRDFVCFAFRRRGDFCLARRLGVHPLTIFQLDSYDGMAQEEQSPATASAGGSLEKIGETVG